MSRTARQRAQQPCLRPAVRWRGAWQRARQSWLPRGASRRSCSEQAPQQARIGAPALPASTRSGMSERAQTDLPAAPPAWRQASTRSGAGAATGSDCCGAGAAGVAAGAGVLGAAAAAGSGRAVGGATGSGPGFSVSDCAAGTWGSGTRVSGLVLAQPCVRSSSSSTAEKATCIPAPPASNANPNMGRKWDQTPNFLLPGP